MNIAISRKLALALVVITVLAFSFWLAACGGRGDVRIRPTWINADIGPDTVSVSAAEVEKAGMSHFRMTSGGTELVYMAYKLGSDVLVRSSICPPCRSRSFSLQGDILVCDSCQTTFSARTGDGVAGPCVDYPKAAVPFTMTGGKLVMKGSDLTAAYQNTVKPGWP
jgi:nitrite reductase/ring-hydroxylating ferredoxin subunit